MLPLWFVFHNKLPIPAVMHRSRTLFQLFQAGWREGQCTPVILGVGLQGIGESQLQISVEDGCRGITHVVSSFCQIGVLVFGLRLTPPSSVSVESLLESVLSWEEEVVAPYYNGVDCETKELYGLVWGEHNLLCVDDESQTF